MSEVKVNKISPRSGTTVTLGDSGDTFTIPSGATINNQGTATNFGATGSASWVTTVKTSTFTAVAGEGYFVNTTGGAVTVNLPAGTAGAVVAIKDYANTFGTNAVTVAPNGSDKIGGDGTTDATLETVGIAVTIVFIDSTRGWLVTDSGLQSEMPTESFMEATGGTVATSPCGNFKTHTFTGPGSFCVSNAGNAGGSNSVEYIVVGGGASGGGGYYGGGGGAGGFRFASPSLAPATYPAKPLAAPANVPISVQSYPIVVGGGGASQSSSCVRGNSGVNSSFSTIVSAGGGGGGVWGNSAPTAPLRTGVAGGSGGGAGSQNSPSSPGSAGTGGAGNTPPVSPPQGKDGGAGVIGPSGPSGTAASAGGGGATVAGTSGPAGPGGVGAGGIGGAGAGVPNAFGTSGVNCGSNYYFAGGGGGAGSCNTSNVGGLGGGGRGANYAVPIGPPDDGVPGTVNTGGAGGGAIDNCRASGAGGSGIVIIRYKFQ
mgnify:FL=1